MRIVTQLLVILVLASCASSPKQEFNFEYTKPDVVNSRGKITGVNLEMPSEVIDQAKLDSIGSINAEWVALIPYGFTEKGDSKVQYGYNYQWWGETEEGSIAIANYAKAAHQKVMIKPHVWVVGDGWPGEFDLATEEEWLEWESTYRTYILKFAKISDSVNADLFCIGTEYRNAAVKREKFWRKLIEEVREIYSGDVTYAANWDNYEKVQFWDALDYIGIDGYFPVSKKQTPTYEEWESGWREVSEKLRLFSEKHDRQIIFTEYGFKSADYATAGYEPNGATIEVNLQNQFNGYKAFFETVWNEDFIAGGFLWKWLFFPNDQNSGENNKRYTPQGKPAFEIVKEVYGDK